MTKKIAIMGTPGFVRAPERFDDEELIQVLGQNSGNLVFQYAVSKIVDAEKVYVSRAETPYSDASAVADVSHVVFPAANHLRLGADWSGLNGYLNNVKVPLVLFGLGAQSPHISGEQDTIDAMKRDPHLVRLVDILKEKASFVSVRGAYTQRVCEEMGLHNTHLFGCPSAMINGNRNLGQQLESKIQNVKHIESPSLGIAAAAPFEISNESKKLEVERKLIAWLTGTKGMYLQQSGAVVSMLASNGRWNELPENSRKSIARILSPESDTKEIEGLMLEKGRFFVNVPEWIKAIEGLDIVMGTRIHGNMAALAAGTPGILCAHDSRTGELGRTMRIPSISIENLKTSHSLSDALERVEFCGTNFDHWRTNTASNMVLELDKVGLKATNHLMSLAS